MFILTHVDEEVVPLSGGLRGLFATKNYYTYTLFLWMGSELEISKPTKFSCCHAIPLNIAKIKESYF